MSHHKKPFEMIARASLGAAIIGAGDGNPSLLEHIIGIPSRCNEPVGDLPPPHLPNHPTQPIAEVKLDRRFGSAGKGKGKALLYVQSNSIWARVRRIGKIKFAFLLRPCWSDDFRFSIFGMVDMQFYKCFSTDYESILIRW